MALKFQEIDSVAVLKIADIIRLEQYDTVEFYPGINVEFRKSAYYEINYESGINNIFVLYPVSTLIPLECARAIAKGLDIVIARLKATWALVGPRSWGAGQAVVYKDGKLVRSGLEPVELAKPLYSLIPSSEFIAKELTFEDLENPTKFFSDSSCHLESAVGRIAEYYIGRWHEGEELPYVKDHGDLGDGLAYKSMFGLKFGFHKKEIFEFSDDKIWLMPQEWLQNFKLAKIIDSILLTTLQCAADELVEIYDPMTLVAVSEEGKLVVPSYRATYKGEREPVNGRMFRPLKSFTDKVSHDNRKFGY